MPPAKKFKLAADAIGRIIPEAGSCLASDRILVDGERVGWMYREAPDQPEDSGWRFLAGDESDRYYETPENFGIYSLNTIANYDAAIIPWLSSPVGSAFGLDPRTGELLPVDDAEL
jgi:hypothetical protein